MAQKLKEADFGLASYRTNRWSVSPPDGTVFEETLARSYWTNVARKLRPGDIIEVHATDGSYYAELYVRAASSLEASVAVLAHYDFTASGAAAPVAEAEEFDVKFRGPAYRYGVVRRSDKHVLKDGFQTAEEANAWLADYRRAMAA